MSSRSGLLTRLCAVSGTLFEEASQRAFKAPQNIIKARLLPGLKLYPVITWIGLAMIILS